MKKLLISMPLVFFCMTAIADDESKFLREKVDNFCITTNDIKDCQKTFYTLIYLSNLHGEHYQRCKDEKLKTKSCEDSKNFSRFVEDEFNK
ncbi:hypothetical protein [Hafnia alvei]|uniref:hypothetical protein n=1 Tax=Hafnia alvei TaxID=569 RepID=UPI0024A81ADA|nr:hypothetical protein [Hafnia alvei]